MKSLEAYNIVLQHLPLIQFHNGLLIESTKVNVVFQYTLVTKWMEAIELLI